MIEKGAADRATILVVAESHESMSGSLGMPVADVPNDVGLGIRWLCLLAIVRVILGDMCSGEVRRCRIDPRMLFMMAMLLEVVHCELDRLM